MSLQHFGNARCVCLRASSNECEAVILEVAHTPQVLSDVMITEAPFGSCPLKEREWHWHFVSLLTIRQSYGKY